MTKSAFATSLQSVSHCVSGNGVATVLMRDFGRGHGLQSHRLQPHSLQLHYLQRTCAPTDALISAIGGLALLFGNILSRFGRDWLDKYQLGRAARRQENGRYRHGIIALTLC